MRFRESNGEREEYDSPAMTLEEFSRRHGTGVGTMSIDPDVSPFPRTIKIPTCPKCEGYLFLSHPVHRADPNVEAKREAGPLEGKVPPERKWLAACWNAECDFFITFRLSELLKCPECGRRCMEGYTLYDHMAHQCTAAARDLEKIREAGVGRYIEVKMLGK